MIVDELLAKFNRIQDLPVSEEMLGAYAEGSVTDSEQMLVSSIADSSPEISALLCEVEDLGEMLTSNSQDLNQNDLMVVSVQELPNVDDYSFADNFKETPFNLETFGAEILDPFETSSLESNISSDVSSLDNDNFFIDGDSSQQEDHSLNTNSDSDVDSNIESDGSDFNTLDF